MLSKKSNIYVRLISLFRHHSPERHKCLPLDKHRDGTDTDPMQRKSNLDATLAKNLPFFDKPSTSGIAGETTVSSRSLSEDLIG